MTYKNRENYVNAPLALVTVEIKLNYDPRANLPAVRDEFGLAVRPEFPVLSVENVVNFSLQLPAGTSEQQIIPQMRATNAARTATVALNPNSMQLTVLGEAYQGYESFAPILQTCLDALEAVLPDAGIERLGIRFLNEVRVAGAVNTAEDWSRWVNAALVAPTGAFEDGESLQVRGNTVFASGDDCQVNFQWGDFEGRTVVADDLPLAKPERESSKFFILDVDSAWQAPEYTVLSAGDMARRIDALHTPIGSIFQWAITEESREVFRGNINV
jgi:uncharacterized protein (TIGR04255 family)